MVFIRIVAIAPDGLIFIFDPTYGSQIILKAQFCGIALFWKSRSKSRFFAKEIGSWELYFV